MRIRHLMFVLLWLVAVALSLGLVPVAQASQTGITQEPELGVTTFEIGSNCPTEEGFSAEYGSCRYQLLVKARRYYEAEGHETYNHFIVFRSEGEMLFPEPDMWWQTWEGKQRPGKGCQLNERTIDWTVKVWADDGSDWSEEQSGTFKLPEVGACGYVYTPPTYTHLKISVKRAKQAIMEHLDKFFVSHLACGRRGKDVSCDVVFNNTYSECRAQMRVYGYHESESGPGMNYIPIVVSHRACHQF